MLRLILLVGVLSSLSVRSATAQTGAVSWPALNRLSTSSLYTNRPTTPLSPRSLTAEAPDTVPKQIRPTHWKEGGIVGAVALGAFGSWFGHEICQNVEDPNITCTGAMIGGGLGGGGIGFLIGALIGGQFPKKSSSDVEAGAGSGR